MKLLHTTAITGLAILSLTGTVSPRPLAAALFEQTEIDQSQTIAIARPYGEGKYDLLILQQIPGKRQCWQEKGNQPTTVDPLLLNFDFSQICHRSTDSNGYSIRLDGQDYGLDYLLRVSERNGELVLVGTPRTDARQSEIIVGRTQGLAEGFLKIILDPGWRFTKRSYNGKILSHFYLTGDSSQIQAPEAAFAEATTDIQTNPEGKIKEITITAGDPQPILKEDLPANPIPTASARKTSLPNSTTSSSTPPQPAVASTVNPIPQGTIPSRTTLPVSPPPGAKTSSNKLPPPPIPVAPSAPSNSRSNQNTGLTKTVPSVSNNPLPPPPISRPSGPPPKSTAPSQAALPEFSQLPPLPAPSPVANSQVAPPPNVRSSNRKTLSDVMTVSPRSASNNSLASRPTQGGWQSQRYRVMVQAYNSSQQQQVRTLYPDAFKTRHRGQSVWQIGVFSSRENAITALQTLRTGRSSRRNYPVVPSSNYQPTRPVT